MKRPTIFITVNGEQVSLRAWADSMCVSYDTVLRRWHLGIRDPDELVQGLAHVKRPITEEDIRILQETRYYRRGQESTKGSGGHRDSEWAIACDLIGIPRSRAEELRKAVDG